MAIKDIIEHLQYDKCDCPVDYREGLEVVNGECPNHLNSKLLVDGVRIDIYAKVKSRLDKK